MKNKKIFSVLLILMLSFTSIIPTFAVIKEWKNIEYSVGAPSPEDGLTKPVKKDGSTVYIDPSNEEQWKEYVNADNEQILSAQDKTSLNNTVSGMKGDINNYGKIMENLKPNVEKGFNMLGDSTINTIITIRSLFSIIIFVVYLIMLMYNGALVAIPGAYDFMTNKSAGDGSNSGGGGKGFGISENTRRVMNGNGDGGDGDGVSQLKKWVPGEFKRLVFLIIILVGLNSDLLFVIINFIMNIFKFG